MKLENLRPNYLLHTRFYYYLNIALVRHLRDRFVISFISIHWLGLACFFLLNEFLTPPFLISRYIVMPIVVI